MKVLFIGGTGNISSASSLLALRQGIELYVLNRGHHAGQLDGAHLLRGDCTDEESMRQALDGHHFDVVVNWIAFTPAHIERDVRLFAGRTAQYVFISSASAYQKPLSHPIITESTPLKNPYWEYSRNKIACEQRLMQAYTEQDFPITIVRPSLTYQSVIPVALGGWDDYTIVDRMKRGEAVVVHGDGSSLWTITHAEDFAVGLVGLLGHSGALGHAFHITSDELLTWNAIYRAIGRAAGVEAKLVHIPTDFICTVVPSLRGPLLGDKAESVIFDNSKIKRFVPQFRPTIRFEQGIKRTLRWFEHSPERMRIVAANNQLLDTILAAYGGLRVEG
jgi:nucleoside-diphosphate-sugar epimerase